MIKEQILNSIPTLTDIEDAHMVVVGCERENLIETVKELANKCKYDALMDLAVVEWEEDMEATYILMNLDDMDELRVSVRFPKDDLTVPSMTAVFNAANVLEREMFDFFGVNFVGHPNLKHLLLADDFVGAPLRKDYATFLRK